MVATGVPFIFLRYVNDSINVPKLSLLLCGTIAAAPVLLTKLSQGTTTDRLRSMLVPAGLVLTPLTIGWAASPYRGWALWRSYGSWLGLYPDIAAVARGVL